LQAVKPERVSPPDYGSKLRDGAGLMALAAEANLDVRWCRRLRSS
jgi:hypothetical protein